MGTFLVTAVSDSNPPIYCIHPIFANKNKVGAGDNVVDNYTADLKLMINTIFDPGQIELLSLPQIFSLNNDKFPLQSVCQHKIPHYIPTMIEEDAELCRKILMASCHTGDEELRKLIDQKDPAKLKLYRGFIKFMEEDLCNHSFIKPFSKSARKKICGKIAFEMIKVSIMILL